MVRDAGPASIHAAFPAQFSRGIPRPDDGAERRRYCIVLVTVGGTTINIQRSTGSGKDMILTLRNVIHDRAMPFAVATLLAVTAYSIVEELAVAHIHPIIFAYPYPWISRLLFSGDFAPATRVDDIKIRGG